MKTISCLLSFLLPPCFALCQEVIYLANPSFEGIPRVGAVPGGWRNCAFNYESPPDIHPVPDGSFDVKKQPQDGISFLGMVTRENGTYESIGQMLSPALIAGQCYSMSIQLCRSESFASVGRISQKLETFAHPVILRIWGGLNPCGEKELLAESPPVTPADWVKYTFQFVSEEQISWIMLEAYFVAGITTYYNGNLLLDNASAIVPISCDTQEPLAEPKPVKQPEYDYWVSTFPKPITKFFRSQIGRATFFLELRLVKGQDEINALILDNCYRTGFAPNSPDFGDEVGVGLKEVAVNVKRHKHLKLLVGMPYLGNELVTKRKHAIKRALKEMGLRKKRFEIIVLPADWHDPSWLCGKHDLWLKLEDRGR